MKKLRNKQTGEIVDFIMHKYAGTSDDGNPMYAPFHGSIEDWEDAPEEPITYYYISDFGAIREGDVGKFVEDEIARKEIGNYFETKKEAELAVRKLKAWKRLKDNRFRFETFGYDMETVKNGRVNLMIRATFDEKYGDGSVKLSDLDSLFGGEE